jgi:hypothetical protein
MITRLTIVSMMLLAAAGCRSMTGQSLGTNVDNATITATVKTKLAADQLHNLTWVDVDTSDGTVYLSGTATTEAQKARATDIARSVGGVKQVVNNIQVKPATASNAASASPGAFQGRHTMTGQVTGVDHGNGHLTLRTDEGDLRLHFPPSALTNVKPGDQVSVELGLRPGQ